MNLKHLDMGYTEITDIGATFLRGMAESPRKVFYFSSAFQNFWRLSSRVDQTWSSCLKFCIRYVLPMLTTVSLNVIVKTPRAGLSNLESLNLDSCKVGDFGVQHFKGLNKLTFFSCVRGMLDCSR